MVENLDPKVLIVFLVTLLLAVFGGVLYRGFASAIAILIAIVSGYVLALIFGLVDFSSVGSASLFELPAFQTPQWSIQAIAVIIPATLVVVSEHIGHQVVTALSHQRLGHAVESLGNTAGDAGLGVGIAA